MAKAEAVFSLFVMAAILALCAASAYAIHRLDSVEKMLSVESAGGLYVCLKVQDSSPGVFYCRTWEDFIRQHQKPIDKLRVSGR